MEKGGDLQFQDIGDTALSISYNCSMLIYADHAHCSEPGPLMYLAIEAKCCLTTKHT